MTARSKFQAIVAATVAVASALPGLAFAAGGGEPKTNPAVTTVRIVTGTSSLAWLKDVAQRYNDAHPNVRVDVRGGVAYILSCAELVAGRADLIVVHGGDDIYQYRYEATRGKLLTMSGAYKPGDLKTHLLGRRSMALLVSPTSSLEEISVQQVLQLTRGAVGQNVADPFAGRKLQYVQDGIFDQEMRERILGQCQQGWLWHLRGISGQTGAWARPGELLDRVVGDVKLLAFQRVGDHVWGSGVKVLPIRLPDGRRVLPTTEHVMSGVYPYYCSLLLVEPAKASPAAKDLAAAILAPDMRRLLNPYWITAETPQPGTPRQTIWPPLASPADQKHAASVAVLPVEQLSAYFRLTDKAVQARYEDDMTAGIGQTGTMTLLDRAQLRRVLSERATNLSAGKAGKPQPIVAADVIVLGRVISRNTVAYLRIEAFHSGTASCLGLLELPINPASSANFDPSLKDLVAGWWPGVTANLVRARKGPIWALTEDASTADDQALAKTRIALEETLAAADGIFFARYSHVPAAQREVLLRLMGVARPTEPSAVAADFVVALGKDGQTHRVTICRAADAKELARQTFADGGCAAWLSKQLARFANETVASGAPAEAQARQEYERGMAIKKQWEKFQTEAHARYRAANRDDYLPEDKARLDELTSQMDRHFERAMQLNPAAEAAAFENLTALNRKGSDYPSILDRTQASLEFMDRFPRSRHFGLAVGQACYGLHYLCLYLGDPVYRAEKSIGIPPGIDHEKLVRQYRRQHLALLASAVQRAGDQREEGYGGMKSRREFATDYQRLMDRYFAIASPRELDDALDEYARACDAHAADVLHSDFLRLRYMAGRGGKQAYIDLLALMQQRWPDPAGDHWKLTGEQTVKEMCELFRIDPGRNSLYLWLKARQGPGDLPYVGYQAASQPATGPAAVVPAPQTTKETE